MSVYVVLAIDINDPDLYAQYIAAAGKALAPFTFKRLSTDRSPKVYEGIQPADNLAILEFESEEDFDKFYQSDLYREAIGLRHAASETRFIMVMKSATS